MNRLDHNLNCTDVCCAGVPDHPEPEEVEPEDDGVLFGIVAVEFTLADPDATLFCVDVRFSLDHGATFHNCTAASGGRTMHDLAVTPEGVEHKFLWDTPADIGEGYYPDVLVLVLVHGGEGWVFSPATIDNTLLADEAE